MDAPADDAAPEGSAPDAARPLTDEEKLARWEKRTQMLIVLAAVLPLAGAAHPTDRELLTDIVAVACWAVFAVDLVVHLRLRRGYLKTGAGLFDLFLVVTTFPWFLLGANGDSSIVVLLRLARVARIARVLTRGPIFDRFVKRLGKPVLYAVILLVTCSIIVTRVEGPANGFTSYWVGLWWGIVTLTTVGYGDLVPKTAIGRWTASLLMIAGVALLGTVAASLASLFSAQDEIDDAPGDVTAVEPPQPIPTDELAALRADVTRLSEDLTVVRALLERAEGAAAD